MVTLNDEDMDDIKTRRNVLTPQKYSNDTVALFEWSLVSSTVTPTSFFGYGE